MGVIGGKGGEALAFIQELIEQIPAVAAIILNGIPGTPMPAWRALLSEEDARWIADTLKQGTLQ